LASQGDVVSPVAPGLLPEVEEASLSVEEIFSLGARASFLAVEAFPVAAEAG